MAQESIVSPEETILVNLVYVFKAFLVNIDVYLLKTERGCLTRSVYIALKEIEIFDRQPPHKILIMKKILTLSLMLLFSIFLFSCKRDRGTEKPEGVIFVDLDKVKNTICLDELAKKVQYINIEENDTSIIGSVESVLLSKDRLVISDNDVTESIFITDLTGKIVSKIDAKGEGPGEYLSIRETRVDESTGSVYILDPSGKIIQYSPGGKLLGTTKLKSVYTKSFIPVENGGFLFYTHHTQGKSDKEIMRLVQTDSLGSVKKKMLSTEAVQGCINHGFPFHIWQNEHEILVSSSFVNNIIEVDKKGNTAIKYKIDFGDAESPLNPFLTPMGQLSKFFENNGTAYYLERFMKSGTLTYFKFNEGRKQRCYLEINGQEYIANRFTDKFGTTIRISSIHANKLIGYIDPISIRPIKKMSEQRNQAYKMDFSSGNDISPIVVLYEF